LQKQDEEPKAKAAVDEDASLALALQLQEKERSAPSLRFQKYPGLKPKDEEFLAKLYSEMLQHHNGDVHRFNASVVKVHFPTLEEIEQRLLKAPSDTPFGHIQAEIEKTLGQRAFAAALAGEVRAILPKMITYFGTPVEPETGINVPALLSRVWHFTSRDPRASEGRQLSLFISLAENINTQGGCYAGVAGRLFRDYYMFTRAFLEIGGHGRLPSRDDIFLELFDLGIFPQSTIVLITQYASA